MITEDQRRDGKLTSERSEARRQMYLYNPEVLSRELKNLLDGEVKREARRWKKTRG